MAFCSGSQSSSRRSGTLRHWTRSRPHPHPSRPPPPRASRVLSRLQRPRRLPPCGNWTPYYPPPRSGRRPRGREPRQRSRCGPPFPCQPQRPRQGRGLRPHQRRVLRRHCTLQQPRHPVLASYECMGPYGSVSLTVQTDEIRLMLSLQDVVGGVHQSSNDGRRIDWQSTLSPREMKGTEQWQWKPWNT